MYDIVEVGTDEPSLAASLQVLRSAFPSATRYTPDYLEWQYRSNPAGPIVGFNAKAQDTGEFAAHYVCQPLRAKVDGVLENGLLSLNTATHPEHQGKGLFTRLAQRTFERAAELGYGFVVGVANQNSTAGFTKKLGFQLVTPLIAKIGIGPLPLARVSATPTFERVWDQESLRWRLANPCGQYTIRDGIIWSPTGKPFIDAAIGQVARGEFNLPKARAAALHLWIGADPRFKPTGSFRYLDIPKRFRPSPLNLIFKDLSGAGRQLDANRAQFWAIDFDPY